MIASIHDRPSVSGTNRKWYSAVSANCRRDSVTTVSSIIGNLAGRGQQMVCDGGGLRVRARLRADAQEPDQHERDELEHDDRAEFETEAAAAAAAEPGRFGRAMRFGHRIRLRPL